MDSELLGWVIRTTLASTAAIGLVLAVRPLCLRLLGARAALWPWLLVPLMMTAVSLPPPTETVVIGMAPAVVEQASADTDPQAGRSAQIHASADPSARISPTAAWSWPDIEPSMLAVWLLGAMIFALHLWRAQRRFLRGLGNLGARGDGSFLAETSEIGPAVIGLLRPRIVLPADFNERYDERQRELILAHERCHLARGDLAMNLLVCALRCLYWFNPLMHLAARHLRFDQELSCDAAVLRNYPNSRRDYADAILNTQLADLGLPVGCYWQSSHPLKWRIIMLTQPNAGRTRLILGAVLVVAASTLAAVSAWAALPAQLVSEVAADAPTIAPGKPTSVGEATSLVIAAHTAQPGWTTAVKPVLAAPAVTVSPVAEVTPATQPLPLLRTRPLNAATDTAAPTPTAIPTPASAPAPAPAPARSPTPDAHVRVPRPALASLGSVAAARMPLTTLLVTDANPAAEALRGLGEIELPRLTKLASVRFPTLARGKLPEEGGIVIVRVDLDEQGNASNLGIEQSELVRAFEAAAISAVRRSEFAPARKNGAAVSCTALVTIHFQKYESIDLSRSPKFAVTRYRPPHRIGREPHYAGRRPPG